MNLTISEKLIDDVLEHLLLLKSSDRITRLNKDIACALCTIRLLNGVDVKLGTVVYSKLQKVYSLADIISSLEVNSDLSTFNRTFFLDSLSFIRRSASIKYPQDMLEHISIVDFIGSLTKIEEVTKESINQFIDTFDKYSELVDLESFATTYGILSNLSAQGESMDYIADIDQSELQLICYLIVAELKQFIIKQVQGDLYS